MLPFLERKNVSGSIMQRAGKADLETSNEVDMSSGLSPELKEASADVMRALESKSPVELSRALKEFYRLCGACGEDEDNDDENDDFGNR